MGRSIDTHNTSNSNFFNINNMVVLKQPEKSIVSLVVVDSLPGNQEHEVLEDLRKISDLVFLFKGVNVYPGKFTSLYQGCGYFISDFELTVETMKHAMEYCLEIFNQHSTFLICPEILGLGTPGICFRNIQTLNSSGLVLPIMVTKRLGCEEFKSIYSQKKGWLGNTLEDTYGMYSSHVTTSPIIMIRPKMVRTLLELSEGILGTFLNSIPHWIASVFERNGIEHINSNPWSNDIVQAEGN